MKKLIDIKLIWNINRKIWTNNWKGTHNIINFPIIFRILSILAEPSLVVVPKLTTVALTLSTHNIYVQNEWNSK